MVGRGRDRALPRGARTPPRTSTSDVVGALRAAGCVFAEDEARLLAEAAAGDADRLAALVARRTAGEPLEHLLGWVEFCGLRIVVTPGVFVPRRRTELLVREAAAVAGDVVVDLCCGSGAVGAAVLALRPGVEVHAVDVDPAAVRCARRNLPGAHVHEGDLDAPLPAALRGRVSVVVAIAPYVPSGAIASMPPEARDHEPRAALDGGPDGLDVVRRIVAAAPSWLAPGGHVLLEVGADQVAAATAALGAAGLVPGTVTDEESGGTVVTGRMP